MTCAPLIFSLFQRAKEDRYLSPRTAGKTSCSFKIKNNILGQCDVVFNNMDKDIMKPLIGERKAEEEYRRKNWFSFLLKDIIIPGSWCLVLTRGIKIYLEDILTKKRLNGYKYKGTVCP